MRYVMAIVLALAVALPLSAGCGLAELASNAAPSCCASHCSMPARQGAAHCCASTSPPHPLAYRSTARAVAVSAPVGLVRCLLTAPMSRFAPAIAPTPSPPLRDLLCSRQI